MAMPGGCGDLQGADGDDAAGNAGGVGKFLHGFSITKIVSVPVR